MKNIVILGALFFLFQPSLSFALSAEEIPDKVFAQFSKMSVPPKSATDFEKWTYDNTAMAAIHCWQFLRKTTPVPPLLKNFKPFAPRVWSLPKDETVLKSCESMVKIGIKPVCTHSTLWAKHVRRRRDLPVELLQVYKNKAFEIEGTLGCYLTPDQIDLQKYAGPVMATWSEKPSMKSINLPSGPRKLEAGTLLVTAPGVPGLDGKEYREPRLTIVIPETP